MPAELERLIVRSLRKDPARRVQHMADVKIELVEIQEQLAPCAARQVVADGRSPVTLLRTLALLAAVTAAVVAWSVLRSRTAPLPAPRLVPVIMIENFRSARERPEPSRVAAGLADGAALAASRVEEGATA